MNLIDRCMDLDVDVERRFPEIDKNRESYFEAFQDEEFIVKYSFDNIRELKEMLKAYMVPKYTDEIVELLAREIYRNKPNSFLPVYKNVEKSDIVDFIYKF